MPKTYLPDTGYEARCGHNFPPSNCPYKTCYFRDVMEIVSECVAYIEHNLPEPGHLGSCGPEAGCDGICVEIASASALLWRINHIMKATQA
jgi:hypothetical protein